MQNYILAKFENLRPEMDVIVVDIKKEMAVAVRKYQWDHKRAKRVFNKAVSEYTLLQDDVCLSGTLSISHLPSCILRYSQLFVF